MTTAGSLLKLTAVVLVVALSITLAAPAKAEAADPMAILAIAGAAVVVVILVVYLIVANTRGSQTAEQRPVYMVCIETPGEEAHCSRPAGTLVAVEGVLPQS